MGSAFLACFAFLGFESLTNMAEATKNPNRTLPRAILLAIAITAFFYAMVALAAVLAVPADDLAYSKTALLLIVARAPTDVVAAFAVIAGIPTVNGVLVEILRVSRLTYGDSAHRIAAARF